jgi:hypothetical protein
MYLIKEAIKSGGSRLLETTDDKEDAEKRVNTYKLSGRDVYYVKE